MIRLRAGEGVKEEECIKVVSLLAARRRYTEVKEQACGL